MELFKANDKLFDLVDANHNLLPVLNRFGIRPGFKDRTVAEVCAEKGINKDFFLALVNTYNNPDYFPEEELLGFSPLLIIDYLRKTHEYYIGYFLPRLEGLLDRMSGDDGGDNPDLRTIRSFYEKYRQELLAHIRDEEENVFPAVVDFIRSSADRKLGNAAISFEKEHTNVEMKLSDLKHLIVKYVRPGYDDNDFFEFLSALRRFEKDIIDHARIEDKILVPQIKGITPTAR
jgi:regulator of cell morphogenesis and NO signaling